MTDRGRQVKRILATYRGIGISEEALSRVVNGLRRERDVTLDEIETALRQEALASGLDTFETEETSGDLAIAGGVERNEAQRPTSLSL